MRIELRENSVIIEGYVNAVGRDSRPMRDKKTGKRFVEQIVPGVFKRALKRNDVDLLLNHDNTRKLGSTATNLSLYEDSIGLRASVEVNDAEVVQKAREKKLRGWSFGFYETDASDEEISSTLTRHFVEDMTLVEVSIIDDRKIPAYEGTSIETRAAGDMVITPEPLEVRAEYAGIAPVQENPVDLSKYHKKIKELEEKKR